MNYSSDKKVKVLTGRKGWEILDKPQNYSDFSCLIVLHYYIIVFLFQSLQIHQINKSRYIIKHVTM